MAHLPKIFKGGRCKLVFLHGKFNAHLISEFQHHPLIGKTEQKFDFLGYHFGPEGLAVADKTIERFRERIARLYEQGVDINRIGQYVLKWLQWTRAEIPESPKFVPATTEILK